MIGVIAKHRQLVWEMTRREVTDRYAGQYLGALWALGHPLIQMGIYLFIFAVVFKVKVARSDSLPMDYTIYLLSGLIPWMGFVEAMNKGTTAVTSNAALVKQVIFPLEVLPAKGTLASMASQLIMWLLLVLYALLRLGTVPWTMALLPLLVLLQLSAMLGVSALVSAVGVYFRDLKDVVTVFSLVGLYLMPIFYSPEMLPERLRPILYLNPFSYMTWCFQDACYYGRFEHPIAWAVFPLLSLLALFGGSRIFARLKLTFGNYL